MRFSILESGSRDTGHSLLSLLALFSIVTSNSVYALDWTPRYGVDANLGYDDNFRLTESAEVETTSGTVGLSANLEGRSEVSSMNLSLGASATEYSDSSIDDSDEYQLGLSTSRRGERLSGSIGVSFVSASTATTELVDTGVIVDGTRETLSVAPTATYSINELNSLSVSLRHQDVSYDTVSLIDYVDNAVTLSWSHQLSENKSISANLSMSRYEPDERDETDTESFSAGYNWRTSPATAYTLALGYSDVDRPNARDSGSNYSFSVDHATDQLNSFVFSLNQGFQPSGRGEVIEQTSLSLQWTRGLTDRARFNLGAQAVSDDVRDYFSINAGIGYQLTQSVNIGGNVRYRREDTDAGSPDSTSVFVSIAYRSI